MELGHLLHSPWGPQTFWALGVRAVSSHSPLASRLLSNHLSRAKDLTPIPFSSVPRTPPSDLLPLKVQLRVPAAATYPEVARTSHLSPASWLLCGRGILSPNHSLLQVI